MPRERREKEERKGSLGWFGSNLNLNFENFEN
jgi:hypothetical protein